jgi:hypothetical protein
VGVILKVNQACCVFPFDIDCISRRTIITATDDYRLQPKHKGLPAPTLEWALFSR